MGPSHLHPEGNGHRGKEAISCFYDTAITRSELEFNFESYQCGNEEANVHTIVIRAGGYEVVAEGEICRSARSGISTGPPPPRARSGACLTSVPGVAPEAWGTSLFSCFRMLTGRYGRARRRQRH